MAAINELELSKLAKVLDAGRQERRAVSQLSVTKPELTVPEAYRVQAAGLRMRAAKGERIVGYKMGLTSKAKMQQMGVHQPIYGVLMESMGLPDGGNVDLSQYIHPRIEPEIVFVIGRDVEVVMSPAQALQNCSAVGVALEIIDSRYKDFSFTLPDVIADNCSSAGFVLGTTMRRSLDLANLGIVLERNGEAVQFASSAAILGHPARALSELINMLVAQGETLRAGSIVLAGAATAAIEFKPGDFIRAQAQGLGSVSIRALA
jgi:2-oxo-3-hexenedioate decarboxylase